MTHTFLTPAKGTVYEYTPRLQVFEFTPSTTTTNNNNNNAILFIGGLTDGLLTVPYLNDLNNSIPPGWALYNILFSSSYAGWATGSLDRDVHEIGKCVEFLKTKLGKEKVVLMGNSTGCQDSIHYALSQEDQVDGIILHSPVSDRYACLMTLGDELEGYNKEAKEWLEQYGKDAVLPPKFSKVFFDTPITSYRWLSLFTVGGDDDYFSEDLKDEALASTFGKLTTPTLVLYSDKDEFVPESVDKQVLIKRWESFTSKGVYSEYSSVVPQCSHQLEKNLSGPLALPALVGSVNGFLQDL